MKAYTYINFVFYFSIFSACYFLLAFKGIPTKLNWVVLNAVFELITLPLILLQFLFLVYAINGLIKRYQPKLLLVAILLISISIFAGVVLVK